MKIGTKLTLAFLTLALTIGAVGYVSLALLQKASLKTIGSDLDDQVAATMDNIDRQLDNRLDDLRWFAQMKTLARRAAVSSAAFDRTPNVQQQIATIDAAWQARETLPQIEEIFENDLSVELHEYTEYLRSESGFVVFPEMYVTNKYGVVIGLTGRTNDYLQADEPWYAEAVATERGSASRPHYDSSCKSLVIDIVIPLRENGEFAGILKGVLSIQDLVRTVESIQAHSHYTTAKAYLVDETGRMVLGRQPSEVGQLDHGLEIEAFGEDLSARPSIAEALDRKHGHFVFRDNGVEKLAVFSRSHDYDASDSPAWTLIMEYDTSEVLQGILLAKHSLLLASLVVTLLAGLGGLALARSISAPINELTRTAARLAGIGVDEEENGRRLDEVAILTRTFERMTRTLRQSEEELRKEHESLRNLLDASDRERRLIAYEIHDGVAQQLTAAKMQLEAFDHLQHTDPQSAQQAYARAVTMLSEVAAEIRRLISGLRPPIIDEMGIVSAIEHLVGDVETRQGIKVDFFPNVEFDRLSPPLENTLFRVAQEGLTNAYRHSQSDKVRIELAQQNGYVRIEVRDWGVGFTAAQVSDDCFGIKGIRERARLFGGEATIDSTPGEGTRVVVKLPIVQ
ncbi:MAG: histidine kinase [Thermoguttaceae bacterium]